MLACCFANPSQNDLSVFFEKPSAVSQRTLVPVSLT